MTRGFELIRTVRVLDQYRTSRMIGRIVYWFTTGGVRRSLGKLLVVALALAITADVLLGTNLFGWVTVAALVLLGIALAVGRFLRNRVDGAGLIGLGPVGDLVSRTAGLVTSVGRGLERLTEFIFE